MLPGLQELKAKCSADFRLGLVPVPTLTCLSSPLKRDPFHQVRFAEQGTTKPLHTARICALQALNLV